MREKFDFEKAVKDLLSGKKVTGKDGVLTPLIKELVEAALEAEIESHIREEILSGKKNRRNGYSKKQLKTASGEIELSTPRDRESNFSPQIVKKHQSYLSDEIESRILSMYALGMSYSDISKNIEEIYQVSLSSGTISALTDKIISKVKEWQQRPLEKIYQFIWLDAIYYKIK